MENGFLWDDTRQLAYIKQEEHRGDTETSPT